MSHLFAYLARMKFIRRWGLMHNTYPENIQEHSLRVAMIAHALAVIRNRRFRGGARPHRNSPRARYPHPHWAPPRALPAPLKYFYPRFMNGYSAIEAVSQPQPVCHAPDQP